jgi:multimeric flavodoxin WrbA
LIRLVFAELEKEGIGTELVQLGSEPLGGCTDCRGCRRARNGRCVREGDRLNGYFEKMKRAQGVLLGSPTYVAGMSANMKALVERCTIVSRANDHLLARKVGAAVIAVRRAGATSVLASLNYFFFVNQMIVPGSSYWNLAVGRDPGEVAGDQEGVQTMATLGRNMAWLLKKLAG